MVITTRSPSSTCPSFSNSSSASISVAEGSLEVGWNETGCTPLNKVTLLKVLLVGVNAKIGAPALTRDIHSAVEPDWVKATIALTLKCDAAYSADMAID